MDQGCSSTSPQVQAALSTAAAMTESPRSPRLMSQAAHCQVQHKIKSVASYPSLPMPTCHLCLTAMHAMCACLAVGHAAPCFASDACRCIIRCYFSLHRHQRLIISDSLSLHHPITQEDTTSTDYLRSIINIFFLFFFFGNLVGFIKT